MKKIVEANNLTFSYDGITNVIENISFNAFEGKITALAGPNGSGKTTFVRIISGILKNYTGTVKIYSDNVLSLPSRKLAKIISYVPGEIYSPFSFNIKDLLLMGRTPYISLWQTYRNEDFDTVKKLVEDMGISHLLERDFNSLSNGEKQIILISQALVQNTPVVIMDEPTSHLDINYRIKIFKILRKYSVNENKTVIVVLHDFKFIKEYCDFVFFMKKGRGVFFTDVSEIEKYYSEIASVYGLEKDEILKFL